MAMTESQFWRLHARIYRMPRGLLRPALGVLFAYMRRTSCAHGRHVPDMTGHACCVCCATLKPMWLAWQSWLVTLRGGDQMRVYATTEAHARNLIIYGESSDPGQTDMLAMAREQYRVHPDNIVACKLLANV